MVNIETIENKVKKLNSELEHFRNIESNEKSITEMKWEIKEMKDQVEICEELVDEFDSKIENLSNNEKIIKWDIKNIGKEIQITNDKVKNNQEKINIIDNEIESINTKIDSIEVYNDTTIKKELWEHKTQLKQANIDTKKALKEKADKEHTHVIEDIEWLPEILEDIKNKPAGSFSVWWGVKGVKWLVAWTNVTIDNTDPRFPVINATGWWSWAVDSVNWQTGVVVLDQDDIGDGATYKQYSDTEKTKLAGIEAWADITDATNVGAAWAFMKATDDTDDIIEGATNLFMDSTEQGKLANITVTQAVDLDQMESDIAALANGMVYKWNWDASVWTFPWAWIAQTWWFYTVSVGGTVDSVVFAVDDRLVATTDNASTTIYAWNWTKLDATDAVTSVNGQTWNVTWLQEIATVISWNTTASNDWVYVVVASATFTDPSPVEWKWYKVIVRNGTATVWWTGYAVAWSEILRIYHSWAWANYLKTPSSWVNTWDQTSIVGITGTLAEFNTALTDWDFATLAWTETLSNKTLSWATVLEENASLQLDWVLSADGKWSWTTITWTAWYTQAFWDLVTLDKDDSRREAVDISVAAAATWDARGLLWMVISAWTDGTACTILLQGTIRADANFPALTIWAPVYASTTWDIVVTQPSTTDYVIRIIWSALTADSIYFSPWVTWITHT